MITAENVDLNVVHRALAGDSAGLETLAMRVRERVYPYFMRVTLNEHDAGDLTQNAARQVLASVAKLKGVGSIDHFWFWVFKIATDEMKMHFRTLSRRSALQALALGQAQQKANADDGIGVAENLAREELIQSVREAMARLSVRHRIVLVLRFYEDMTHSQMAQLLGGTEVRLRATSYRAKRALQRELKRFGIGKTSLWAAMAAFGGATLLSPAPSAATTVSASAISGATVKGLLSAGAKATPFAAVIAAVVVALWSLASPVQSAPNQDISVDHKPVSIHYFHQAVFNEPNPTSYDKDKAKRDKRYVWDVPALLREHWYYFPEGVGGPFFERSQSLASSLNPYVSEQQPEVFSNAHGRGLLIKGDGIRARDGGQTVYLENKQAIYLRNNNVNSIGKRVTHLPTDSREFSNFILRTQGATLATHGGSSQRDPKTGYLVCSTRTRLEELGPFETVFDYSELDVALFDFPDGIPVIDGRDEMHKRGWTYFRVEGELDGMPVTGVGRVPFVYAKYKTHPPWLKLNVGGKLAAMDTWQRAALVDGHTGQVRAYAGGSLFSGLSKPWIGFHTIDTIRRDAAKYRIPFCTAADETGYRVDITLVKDHAGLEQGARYQVDVLKDLLKKIEFWEYSEEDGERSVGQLTFTYLDKVDEADAEFQMPDGTELTLSDANEKTTPFWPLSLVDAQQKDTSTSGSRDE